MKKFMTFIVTAAMVFSVCSVNVFANEPAKAVPSNAKVSVNGTAIAPQAYTIDGYTYFKLRDVAKAVAGTVAGFGVEYDHEAKMAALVSGAVYKENDAGKEAASKVDAATKNAYLIEDAMMVNGKEMVLDGYYIDDYGYYKLRTLGDVLGFDVTWDNAAKMIGINAAALEVDVTETETGALEYVLDPGSAYNFNNETFTKEVVLVCNPNAADIAYEAYFENCTFEKGLKVISDRNTNVVIGAGCVFGEGTGVVFEEVTEGNHLKMTLDDPFPRVYAETAGVNITTDDIVTAFGSDTIRFTLNGTEYNINDVENTNPDGPASAFCVVQYHENGEVVIYGEAW